MSFLNMVALRLEISYWRLWKGFLNKGRHLVIFRKTLIKPLYKKGDKSECRNYWGINLVSVGSKLLSIMILFRLRDAVDKVLREEQCGFWKVIGCVDQIFTLRLIIEKCLCYQTPLVLSFIDYEQTFDVVDRRAWWQIVLFGHLSGTKRKAGRPCLGWDDVINEDLKKIWTSWVGVRREPLSRLGWRRSLRSCVGLRQLGAAISYYYYR